MKTFLLKICGLTRIADFRHAQRCGADFLGIIVDVPFSPRSLPLAAATHLAVLCPQRVVAVTTSIQAEQLTEIVQILQPHALQLHNPQALAAAQDLRGATHLWLAVPVPSHTEAPRQAVEEAISTIAQAQAHGVEMIILDTISQGRLGGTGQTSDWDIAAEIVRQSPLPVLLAGGIGPDNAREALERVQPAGIDASSRLEICPGQKNPLAVRALTQIVKGTV